MKLRRIKITGIIIAVALALTSCNRHTIYSHYEPVDMDGWERSDTLLFCVNNATDSIFSEQLGLRINSKFPYRDLALVVEQRLQHNPCIIKSDTLYLNLANEDGLFIGKGLNIFHYDVDLGTIVLPKADTLQVSVYHNMRREMLPGVASIGITVVKEP